MSSSIAMQNPDDGFPIEFVNAARVLGRYASTASDADALAAIIPLASYPRVLDVCCGFGRTAGKLHQLGYQVTGIDLSAEQIALARCDNPGPAYVVSDMRALPPQQRYDAIVNLFTSFGYFATVDEDVQALHSWCAALRPGGKLIMELADMDLAREKLDRSLATIYRYTGDVIEECVMDWEQQIFRVKYLQNGEDFTCYTRLYESAALKEHLLAAGFSDVQLFGGLDLRARGRMDNLVLIATK